MRAITKENLFKYESIPSVEKVVPCDTYGNSMCDATVPALPSFTCVTIT